MIFVGIFFAILGGLLAIITINELVTMPCDFAIAIWLVFFALIGIGVAGLSVLMVLAGIYG